MAPPCASILSPERLGLSDLCQIRLTIAGAFDAGDSSQSRNRLTPTRDDHGYPPPDRICKPEVTGSIPVRSTIEKPRKSGLFFVLWLDSGSPYR